MTHRSRFNSRGALLKAGRWTCAAWIAAVDRMKIGDYVVRTSRFHGHLSQPLQAE